MFLAVHAAIAPRATRVAEASATPHIVVAGDVWLLDEFGEKLFLLPDTYYARINNLDENYYYVTFNGVNGKVQKNIVSTVGYHATATGTSRDITISGDYSEFVAINLKKAPDVGAENACQVPLNETITYLGSYPKDNALWYYVGYNGNYGYLKAERTSMPQPSIPTFTPEVPETVPASAEESSDKTETALDKLTDKQLKIVVIVGLAVPAVAVIILLFRPVIRKNKRKETYYDD